ncbi:MAG: hypothetical protein Q8R70_05980 [Methanoregula sp.]|nr:hypothetical protein [Methanoregula sp.]
MPRPPAGPAPKKEGSKTAWIIIGAVILLIVIAALFFLFKSPAPSKAPVVGKWAAGNNWVQMKDDYSAEAFEADSGLTVEGTWEEMTPTRYQVDWDTGGQDIMIYNPSSKSLIPEGSSVQMTKVATPEETTGGSSTGQIQTTCDPAAEELFLITESNAAVQNNPPNPRVITIGSPMYVTRVMTYHYNSNQGAVPGTIALKDEGGKIYGPWQAVDDKGSTGIPSIHWTVKINEFVPAGKYTIIDSDPSTWSHNSEVGNAGVVWVYVSKKCSSVAATAATRQAAQTTQVSQPALTATAASGDPVTGTWDLGSTGMRMQFGADGTATLTSPATGYHSTGSWVRISEGRYRLRSASGTESPGLIYDPLAGLMHTEDYSTVFIRRN